MHIFSVFNLRLFKSFISIETRCYAGYVFTDKEKAQKFVFMIILNFEIFIDNTKGNTDILNLCGFV